MSREIDVLVARIIFGMTDFEVNLDGYMIKNYSTDIAAAWEIPPMIKDSEHFYVSRMIDGKWAAQFCPLGNHIARAEADTAPMAICLAALKAVGYES